MADRLRLQARAGRSHLQVGTSRYAEGGTSPPSHVSHVVMWKARLGPRSSGSMYSTNYENVPIVLDEASSGALNLEVSYFWSLFLINCTFVFWFYIPSEDQIFFLNCT